MGMTSPKVETTDATYLTVPVKLGNLELSLSQRGLLDSAQNIIVASECERTARIINLIPEGTWVEEGDIVVELDSSEMSEMLKEREIDLIDAEADLIQAQEVLAMQHLENESGLAKAQLALQLAQLDLQKYAEGDFPKAEKEAKAAVALAEEDVSRAKERYEYTARLVRKGYESPMSLEKERLALLEYENKLKNVRRELSLLIEYTKSRTMTELKAAEIEAKRALDQVEKISRIAVLNRQVQVHSRTKKRDSTLEYVERLRKSIAACTIRAPATGEIIYANEGSIRNEIVEGEYVRNRQEVVRVPDLSQMEVKLRIHESLIDGVREGLPATIQLDAFPDKVFMGEVNSVSRVPTSGRNYNYDLKEYDATVRLDATPEELNGLKPGLTAQVKVLIDRQLDCLSVPAQSVVNVSGKNVVFVRTAEGIEHREIELGVTNDVAVEVVSGLTESEEVLLSPRTTCSDTIIALRESFGSETDASETDVANIGG